MPLPPQTGLFGLVTLGPRNTWAIGSGSTGFIYHWDGSRWRSWANVSFLPQDISASSGSNVWVAGLTASGKVAAARWGGSVWHAAAIPHPLIDTGPTVLTSSPADVWIGWDAQNATVALHCDGHHWHKISAPGRVGADDGIVRDGIGGHWFGAFARLDSGAWTGLSLPPTPGGGASATRS